MPGNNNKNVPEPVSALDFSAHTAEASKVVAALNVDPKIGLSEEEAAQRLAKYGPNRIKPPPKANIWKIIGRQVANAMTAILIGAMAVSFGVMDWISGGVIAALILLNISVGTWTEWEAEKIVASLESVGAPIANVVRHNAAGVVSTRTIAVDEVVPGDIVVIKNGDIVPADGRVLDGVSNLEADEAFLTGESLPVAKQSEPVGEDNCPVGDRVSMVFSGAQITKGRAHVVVTSTGMGTEIGKIAKALQNKAVRTETGWAARVHRIKVTLGLAETSPLQIKLNSLAYTLLCAAIVTAIVVLASTGFKNIPKSMATYTVAAAVSMLPVSIVAVVSLTLAQASSDLAKRNALVRRMDAIEALAGIYNVCSDKTGTLTVGRMVVKKMWVPVQDSRDGAAPTDTTTGQVYGFETGSDPFYPRGEVTPDDTPLVSGATLDDKDVDQDDVAPVEVSTMERGLRELAICTSLCNQATLAPGTEEGQGYQANGDPTEVALQVAAHKLGFDKPHLTGAITHAHSDKAKLERHTSRGSVLRVDPIKGHYEQVLEHPFDSTVKRMSMAYKLVDGEKPELVCVLKGAVERVLPCCTHVRDQPLTDSVLAEIMTKVEALASQGLRVLAFAAKYAPVDKEAAIKAMPRADFEQGFTFLGLAGIFDPPRKESPGAVADCRKAGITPRMLTGDHPATATAIALQIGILDGSKSYSKSAVMTGQQFDALTDAEVDALDDLPLVVARCAPETKVRMVDAIHRRKQTTAMTGDGVNDSPALKRADVGVAMGTGSDVAKQSARIILTDDNFASAIRAIRKGRSVFKNLSKFLLYLLSGNIGELVVLLIGLAFRDEKGHSVFPLSPVAALWINTLTAGPPAMALGLEPTAADAMDQPPSEYRTLFTWEFYIDLAFYGLLMGAQALINFVIVMYGYFPGDLGVDCNDRASASCDPVFAARACCMATLMIVMLIHALQCKHSTMSLFKMNLMDNKVLLWCVVVLVLSMFPVVYIPVINDKVFLIGQLKWEWGIVFGMVIVYFIASEAYKWCKRIYFRRRDAKRARAPPASTAVTRTETSKTGEALPKTPSDAGSVNNVKLEKTHGIV
ncbi:hypothetical protein Q8F55_004763 [Vanrija albida]|uniref:Cation-transporting P-type ATPase N-terminal domain-containing protein n=1 Tax=Vanrija albida TaxID=181172 RepID=A0ABR3PZR0_9TREE